MYASVHSVTNSSAVVDWSRPSDPNGIILGYQEEDRDILFLNILNN